MVGREDTLARGLDFSPPHRLPKILRRPDEPQQAPQASTVSSSDYELEAAAERGALTPNYAGVALAVLIAVPLGIAAMLVFGDVAGH